MFKLTGIDIPTIEILKGASFGEELIQKMFQGSEWIFYDDGKFTFQGKSSQWDNSISGTYVKADNNFEFQGEYDCDDNRTISMDGTIYEKEGELVLETIYTNLVFSQQIATISQKLIKEEIQESELTLEPEKIEENEIDEDLKKLLEESGNFLQEMEEIYGSISEQKSEYIKTPNQFKVSLKGKTDRGSFESLPGTLFIMGTTHNSQDTFSISLGINPDLFGSNGWIRLNFPEAGSENANRQMTVKKNQVCIQFNSDNLTNAPIYTLGTDELSSDLDKQVLIENFTFTFTVEEDNIFGDIKASGRHLRDLEKTSTYEVKLTGQIPKSLPVEKLKTTLLSKKFNGKWDTGNSSLGHIELQQYGQKVRGTYTRQNGGTIEGIVQGNRLDFQWQDDQRNNKGQGFLRAVAGGGKLVGSICLREHPNSLVKAQIVIGFWQLPSIINLETFNAFDLEELRSLSQDLTLKYKYDQAVVLLNKLISYYLPPQEEQIQVFEGVDRTKESEQEQILIDASSVLGHLTNCHFQLGKYEQLLKDLDYGLEIQRLLGPEESASRLFREITADIADALTSEIEPFNFMENAYKVWQQMVSGSRGIVGISLEQDEINQEVFISSIKEDGSADIAGIIPGDRILKINGKTTEGLDKEQVLEQLQGNPGSLVNIIVGRNNQKLEFQLIRKQIEISSMRRQAKLVETLEFSADSLEVFVDSRNHFREMSTGNVNRINTATRKIAQGQKEPASALLYISSNIENQIIKLNQEINTFIDKLSKIFIDHEKVLEELSFIFDYFKNFSNRSKINVKDLDAKAKIIMQMIDNSPDITVIEKQIFKAYYTNIIVFFNFVFQIESQLNYIKKIDPTKRFLENRKRAEKNVSMLSVKLEEWRGRLAKDFDKIKALDQGKIFFQKAIKFLISLEYQEAALVMSEKSRARAFADLLSGKFGSTSNVKSQFQSIAANSPTIEQIKQIAKKQNATLIEYTIINESESQESQIYIWVVNPDGTIKFVSIDIPDKMNDLSLEQLVSKFSNFIDSREQDITRINSCLQQISQVLITPISEFLPDEPNSTLIFIPQDFLFLIPFAALQDKEGNSLIQKHIVLTAPSIHTLDLTNQPRRARLANSINSIVLGNPTMPSIKVEDNNAKPLQELPASEAEVKAIASLLHTEAIIADQATKAKILEQISQAKLIHFATHGILDGIKESDIPGAIALAPDANDDGFLTSEEIMKMFGQSDQPALQAELLVLSACETGLGKITGDGVVGLSRSLMAAGIPRVVVSLWKVSDLSTALLMIKFYEILQPKILKNFITLEPADVAKALNQAQKWLTSLNSEEAKQELEKLKPHICQALSEKRPRVAQAQINQYLNTCNRAPYPFASPRYWAGFTTIGV